MSAPAHRGGAGSRIRERGTAPSIQGCKVKLGPWVYCGINQQLLSHEGPSLTTYMEPFAGTLSVMCLVRQQPRRVRCAGESPSFDAHVAGDINPDLVALLQHAQSRGAEGLPTFEDCTEVSNHLTHSHV
jgi:hypothetical protein